MKGKWTKILLIINMFLCLFGVQIFDNKNYDEGLAATRTQCSAISLFVWTQKCFGNTSGSVFNKFVITSATYESSYDGDDLLDWFNNYRGPLATENTTDTFKNNTSITKSGNNYEITQNGYQVNVAKGWYDKPGNMSRVFLFPPFVTAVNGYVTNSSVGGSASSKLALNMTSSGDNRYAYAIWHDSNTSMGLFNNSNDFPHTGYSRSEYFDKCTITKKYSGTYGSHTIGSTIGTEYRWQYAHHDRPSNPSAITGYTFSDWVTAQGGSTSYNGSTITGDKSIYAKYNINKYTVTFMVDGSSHTTKEVAYNNQIGTLPTAPSKTGYTFSHWAWGSTSGTEVKPTDLITSNRTAHAVYTKNGYTVNYYDGITGQLISGYTETVADGETITHTTAPGKTGYTFKYWCTDSSLNTEFENNTPVTSNLNLYAKYDINQYTVSFVSNGVTISSSVYNHGQTINIPANPTKPSTDDKVYTFDKWSGSDGSTLTSGQTITATKTITYTAIFTSSIRQYDITYRYDGKSQTIKLNYGAEIIANAPDDAKKPGKKITWYFDDKYTAQVTGDSIVDGKHPNIYAKYEDLTYASVYLDYSEFTAWSFTASHFYVYSSTSDVNNTWPGQTQSEFKCGSIISLGNNLYQINLDETYDKIIVNNGVSVNGRQTVTISLTPNSDGERIKYVKLTNSTRKGTADDGESVVNRDLNIIEIETNLNNLLKTQKAPISGTDDMYRFTFGVNDTNKYGLSFIFITSGNQSTIRYWNFSTDSKLNEVRLGTTLYNTTSGYSGYYSLTIKENSSFNLTSYNRFVVLACYKDDSTGVNVLKAVEYKINSNGSLTRVV